MGEWKMTAISGYGQNPFMMGGAKKVQQPQNTAHSQAVKPTEHLQKPAELNKNKEMAASQINPMATQRLNFNA